MFLARQLSTMGGDVFRDEFSLHFDGGDEHLNCGKLIDLGPDDFTIMGWVKAAGDSIDWANNYIIGQHVNSDNYWYIRFKDEDPPVLQLYSKLSGSVENAYFGNGTVNGRTMDDRIGEWVHFAISSDRDGQNVGYINGNLDDNTDNADAADMAYNADWTIGGVGSNHSEQHISEIAVYNKALSGSEIATIYNSREPYNHKEGVCSSNLTSWWRMGDGVNDTPNVDSEGGIIGDESTPTLGADLFDEKASIFTSGTYAWEEFADSTISNDVRTLKIVKDDDSSNNNGAKLFFKDASDLSSDLTVGKVYKCTFDVKVDTGNSVVVTIVESGTTDNVDVVITNTSFQTYTLYFIAGHATNGYIKAGNMQTGEIIWFDNISLQEVGGTSAVMQNMEVTDFKGDTP